jgi:hypothetical protein
LDALEIAVAERELVAGGVGGGEVSGHRLVVRMNPAKLRDRWGVIGR